MPRFTILLHKTRSSPNWRASGTESSIANGSEHWDWLFESEIATPEHPDIERSDANARSLLTWATDPLSGPPRDGCHSPTPAIRLANHRRLYLDFEGDLDGERGSVRRIAWGDYSLIEQTDELFEVALQQTNQTSPKLHLAFRQTQGTWLLEIDAF